jgi:ubiquitin carboxyl-terminal hydrolase 34
MDIAHTMREPSPVPPGTPTRPNSTEPNGSPLNVISISSSPTQSPEIQAADPEDMDENWRPLSDAVQEEEVVEVHDLPSSLVDTFPRVRENLTARDNLVRIVSMIQKGKSSLYLYCYVLAVFVILRLGGTADPRDADAASAVKSWMDDCVKNLDRLTLEEFGESQEFWQQLPDAVESVLRRP